MILGTLEYSTGADDLELWLPPNRAVPEPRRFVGCAFASAPPRH
jgi:hypothetical protein